MTYPNCHHQMQQITIGPLKWPYNKAERERERKNLFSYHLNKSNRHNLVTNKAPEAIYDLGIPNSHIAIFYCSDAKSSGN